MAPKIDREWQGSLDLWRRELWKTEKLDKKSMENIQDIYGKISENIGEKND